MPQSTGLRKRGSHLFVSQGVGYRFGQQKLASDFIIIKIYYKVDQIMQFKKKKTPHTTQNTMKCPPILPLFIKMK